MLSIIRNNYGITMNRHIALSGLKDFFARSPRLRFASPWAVSTSPFQGLEDFFCSFPKVPLRFTLGCEYIALSGLGGFFLLVPQGSTSLHLGLWVHRPFRAWGNLIFMTHQGFASLHPAYRQVAASALPLSRSNGVFSRGATMYH